MPAIAWEALRHAAGAADDVPDALESLRSKDDDERDFAVGWVIETLFEDEKGAACIHSATLPAAQALVAFVNEDLSGTGVEETQAEILEVLGDLYVRFVGVPNAEPLLRLLAPFAVTHPATDASQLS
jgi:hypothetical protein